MAENEPSGLRVEVVYADSRQVHVLALAVADGTTVRRAIELSGILEECPEIDLGRNKVGIYSKICKPDVVIDNNCRIEIYRPLLTDPKEARRKRAQAEKT